MEQLSIFDYVAEQQPYQSCQSCENCKPTNLIRSYVDGEGNFQFLAFCNPTRQCITKYTASWLCKNRFYRRKEK